MALRNAFDELALDSTLANGLQALLGELQQKLDAGEDVGLTLGAINALAAALDGLMVQVNNFPATFPNQHIQPLTDVELRNTPVPVNTGLSQPVQEGGNLNVANFPASQTVDGTVAVSNQPADPATNTTLAAVLAELQAVLVELGQKYEGGAIALDAATLAALDEVTATVTNFPSVFPLPAAQAAALAPQTDALTDIELRATPVPVDTQLAQPVQDGGTVNVGNLPVSQTVDGEVNVGNLPVTYPDQHDQPLTDTQLRNAPVPVNTGLAQPVEDGGMVLVGNQPADPATETTLMTVRDRLAPTLPADVASGLPERLHVQQLAPLPEGPFAIGFTTDSGVLQGAIGAGFAAGGPPMSTTSVVRGLLVNPPASGKVLIVAGFVVGHDEGNSLIPVEIVRNPTANIPTTRHDEMNLSMGAPHGPFTAVAEFYQQTGSAMTGGDSMWVPSSGSVPNSYELRIPAFLWPGTSIGVNFDIGALLASGTGMVAVTWAERDEADILELLVANGIDLGGP